jgi:signal transduction histidine kinase
VNNLIENAIKYTSNNKIVITIDKSFFEVENEIDFIPNEEQMNNIFEPFFKFDTSRNTK